MIKPKHKQILRLAVILAVLFISSSYTGIYNMFPYDFGDFKNKSYYTELFNKSEILQLTDADDLHNKGKSYLIKAEKSFRKADGYNKIDENYGGKTKKKALRYEKKAIKDALKAYELYFQATEKKFRVYSERLNNMENNNSKKHLKAEEMAIDARSSFLNGTELIQDAKNLKGKDKLEIYEKAYIEHISALEKQETAFMIFMNDPEVKYDKLKDDLIVDKDDNNDNVTDDNEGKTNDYQPGNDPNLYISKEEEIIENLKLSPSDKMALDDARDKRNYADIIIEETDNDYAKIENIRNEAELIEDEYERELKYKMAEGLEKVLFDKMIKAAELYFEADKSKYEIYFKYLPSARTSEGFEEGKKYEENAVKLHSSAQKIYHKTNFYSDNKSTKYIQLMNAVQNELSAIQEQENAFSVYFKFNVSPLEEISDVNTENNNSGKTNDNNSGNVNKLTYNYSGSFIYSKEEPKPKPLIHKDGIIFKVQIGLFKNLLPLNQYGNYSPISYDTYKNNPYKRFMLGEYRSYKSAEFVLNKLKEKGMNDPFIVSYENGLRKSATYGLAKIIRDEAFEKAEAEEMAYLKGESADISEHRENDIDFSELNNIELVKGLGYFIQIGNFSTQKTKNDFSGIEALFVDQSGSSYKYLTGVFASYEDAKENITILKNKGYNDVFVTAYKDGKKISLDDAKNEAVDNIQTNKKDIFFSVQIGVYSKVLNENELKEFTGIKNKYKLLHKEKGGGIYIYYIGEYNSYDEANTVKKDIKNMGHDGFVIAFKNGEKISAKQAVELLKNQ